MVDQGWLGVEVGEADGGLGLGSVEVAVLVEELGRHAAPVPFVPTVLALDAFAPAGDDAWVQRLLDRRRDRVRRVGRGRAGAVRAVGRCRDRARRRRCVRDARSTERPRARARDGSHARAGLVAVRPATARALGGADARTRLLDRGATFTSADLLGSASRALDIAVEYAKDRVQFGRPIGSFQAVKHRCADMLVDVEGMRSTVYWAAWCIGAGDADASVAASTAKIWCGDASKRVMASALQVHGGIGFTWEHDLHFFLKRAQLDQLAFGDASAHRERLAALLRPRVEAGESVV